LLAWLYPEAKMSFKVFILDRDTSSGGSTTDENGNATYSVVIQAPTPAGYNAAGIPWPQVLIAKKRNTTVMTVGVQPSQITQAEKDAIVAGTNIEYTFTWTTNPTWPELTRTSKLQEAARAEIDKQWRELVNRYYFYGYTAVFD
jgi:hypothetical protein